MKPLHVRAPIAAALFIGASAVLGYVANGPQPTLGGVIALLAVTIIPSLVLAMVAIDTNRRIRASGLDRAPNGPLWGKPATEDRRARQ